MKQGKFYTKFIVGASFLAVVGYLVYALFANLYSPLATTIALEYEAGEGYGVMGYVVREETVLTANSPIIVPQLDEGEKVGVNQIVAMGFATDVARQNQSQIDALSLQLAQLDYIGTETIDPSAIPALDAEILDTILHFNNGVAQNDLQTASEYAPQLQALVIQRTASSSDIQAMSAQRASLESQLATLQSSTISGTPYSTHQSGFFSQEVDGFESVLTPNSLTAMTPSDLDNLQPDTIDENAYGRLVTGKYWYYVAAVPTVTLEGTSVGDKISLSFTGDFDDLYQVTVTHISDDDNGESLIVLRTKEELSQVTLLRYQQSFITFQTYSGIRVPKTALRVDEDGNPGVYILESANATWKNVEILYDNDDSYVVTLDKSSTNNLWPGDVIIVQATDLYDGKVVE